MTENQIELKSVGELLGMKFFIPSYQRGYRWTEQQVKDLLDDIEEFRNKFNNKNNDNEANSFSEDYYCLQPLVVKETVNVDKFKEQLFSKIEDQELLNNTRKAISDNTKWEVIDGQQRLTTMYVLLSYLNNKTNENNDLYEISYQTRDSFEDFYKSIIENDKTDDTNTPQQESNNKFKVFVIQKFQGVINQEQNQEQKQKYDNIDFFHVLQTLETIKKWFADNNKVEIGQYKSTILDRVKFIWYESVDEDPIRVFTRLNIGKIKLTNAELIKALFLNRSNFNAEGDKHLKLRQQEIASEWDNIEYTLQNDEFWLFLHAPNYDKPTRIDFIFDLICEQDSLKLFKKEDEIDKEEMDKIIGTDEYRTFRYFYEYFKRGNAENPNKKTQIDNCWEEVKKYFQTFQEWFNDLELYHYVGFLIEQKEENEKNKNNAEKKVELIKDLFTDWNSCNETKDKFVSKLKDSIRTCIKDCKDLNKQYEIDGAPEKTICRSLLLLHNIQTIINQNKDFTRKKEYELPVFYKFPFHLFKKEKWDVEHIDSNSENEINDKDSQNEFLLNIYHSVDDETKKKIEIFINNPNATNWGVFMVYTKEAKDSLSDKEKNQVWNFTLLDSSTNRSYGNSIFAAKRRIIIGKDRGVLLPIPKIKKENKQSKLSIGKEEKAKTAFIPPCTKNIFMKYYTPILTNYNYWTKPDAEAYRQNILSILEEFVATDSSNNQNKEKNEQQ